MSARVAEENGIPIPRPVFRKETAHTARRRRGKADLTAANNVLAHVPDINDFVAGFPIVLKPEGVSLSNSRICCG